LRIKRSTSLASPSTRYRSPPTTVISVVVLTRASSLLGRRDARNRLGRLGECYGELIDQDA
jgi:hypothetical protein